VSLLPRHPTAASAHGERKEHLTNRGATAGLGAPVVPSREFLVHGHLPAEAGGTAEQHSDTQPQHHAVLATLGCLGWQVEKPSEVSLGISLASPLANAGRFQK
jgi:hypothetical protein